jgi:hypothetical protein
VLFIITRHHAVTNQLLGAYCPDVLDSKMFAVPYLSTISLNKICRNVDQRYPPPHPEYSWYVTLFLEPDVTLDAVVERLHLLVAFLVHVLEHVRPHGE